MKLLLVAAGVVCLAHVSPIFAEEFIVEPHIISLYQLEHKAPKRAHELFKKAERELRARDYRGSLSLFQAALLIDPDYWSAENNLGYVYLALSDNEKARAAFQRAIAIDPENALGYANFGVTALAMRDYKVAEQCARRALRLAPRMTTAKALLAIVQIDQGQWTKEGRRLLEETTEAIPSLATVLRLWPHENAPAPKVEILTATLIR